MKNNCSEATEFLRLPMNAVVEGSLEPPRSFHELHVLYRHEIKEILRPKCSDRVLRPQMAGRVATSIPQFQL